MSRGYGGRGGLPDLGETVSVVLLLIIAVWGVWFGIQSLVTLWWPINLGYLLAGGVVAGISLGVARALLNR